MLQIGDIHSSAIFHEMLHESFFFAFIASYKEGKKANVFTKTKMDKKAHDALCEYFSENIKAIEGWFNVITPHDQEIIALKQVLNILKNKKWR